MRVELFYTPGCSVYRNALKLLEMVIAEERLPIPIELQVMENGSTPVLIIDGKEYSFPNSMETLRHLISKHWHHLNDVRMVA